MANQPMNSFPNITWVQFAVCNDDCTTAFEDLATQLFYREFLKETNVPHANHNNPGVEVDPVEEPPHQDGSNRRRVSFQAKYFEHSVSYAKIKESAEQTVKHYKGKIDHVYLFCNLTLTMTNKSYKNVEKILNKAGITLQPVSNKDILNLLSKYRDVAEYFFLRRQVTYDMSGDVFSNGMIFSGASDASTESPANISYVELTEDLIAEKVTDCRNYILSLQLSKLKEELDKLFAYDLGRIRRAKDLQFYRFLQELHDKCKCELTIPSDWKDEAEWLQNYYRKPSPILATEFQSHCPEVQVLIIDKLFTSQLWMSIVSLYNEKPSVEEVVLGQLEYHYGLTLFNMQDFESASTILNRIATEKNDIKYKLFSLCADIQIENGKFRNGCRGDSNALISLVDQLEDFKESPEYIQNEVLIALIYLEAYYHLGLCNSRYLEKAFVVYDNFLETTKENWIVKYHLAICYEINGEISKALDIYSTLDWSNNEALAQRYLVCLIENGEADIAISSYREITNKSMKVVGAYLLAKYRSGSDDYREELEMVIAKCKNSIDDVFAIAFYVEDKDAFDLIITPLLAELMNKGDTGSSQHVKNGLVLLLSRWSYVELLDTAVASIEDLTLLDNNIVEEVYKTVFSIVNREYRKEEYKFLRDERLQAAYHIAERMLDVGIMRERFLQIKVMYFGVRNMKLSMLKFSKEYFCITQDPMTARNIIALLYERGVSDPKEYEPYITLLKSSENPDFSIVVALALLKQGKTEEADFYAYKSLYYLDGKDNYFVYKSLFGYYNSNLNRFHNESDRKTVGGNMVVTLETTDKPEEIIKVCLDSEDEFNDCNNHCFGMQHIPRADIAFTKLQGGGLNQVIKIKGRSYRIVSFVPRIQYLGQFIIQKVNDHPEEFEGSIWVLSTTDPQEMMEQIKALTDRTEQTKSLLCAYNREDGGIGLPVDSFINGDYNKYLDAMRMLLFVKDLAFFSGYPVVENFDDSKFVPTLSTLMLASQMGWLHLFEGIKDRIIIPESYLSFFQEKYAKIVGLQSVSPGTLSYHDGQLIIYEPDKKLPEVWEALVDFCDTVEKRMLSDEDRISFSLFDGVTGEQLFIALKIDVIQLDSLILARKEHAQYICDDLFFRQIADQLGIRNLNFASLLYHLPKEISSTIAMELSKTNYIHTPFMPSNEDEAYKMYENLMMGEKKQIHYSYYFDKYLEVCNQVLHEWFDEEQS